MAEERNSFIEKLRLGLIDFVAILILHLFTFGCIHSTFISSKIAFLVSNLSRLKIWWIAIILAFLLITFYKKSKLNTTISTLISIPFIAFFLSLTLIKRTENTSGGLFSFENFALITLILIVLSLVSILISFFKKFEKRFYIFGGIIVFLFFFGRFVFFEEYFFSRINNPELFSKIKPFINGILLTIMSVFWIGISSKSMKIQEQYTSVFVLVYAAFFTFLYFSIFQDAIASGVCSTINFKCFKAMW